MKDRFNKVMMSIFILGLFFVFAGSSYSLIDDVKSGAMDNTIIKASLSITGTSNITIDNTNTVDNTNTIDNTNTNTDSGINGNTNSNANTNSNTSNIENTGISTENDDTNTNTEKVNTKVENKNSVLPYTGKSHLFIGGVLVIAFIFVIISFMKYLKYKNV